MRISDWSSDVCSSDLALGMQVFAEAGTDVGLFTQPADFQRLQFALAVDHAHVDLQTVLVGQKLLHPIVDLQVRADQDQSILGILDEFFKEIVGRTCVEELGHFIPPASLALVSRRIVRSEEHTSELQSLMRISYAVFCLKKKNKEKFSITLEIISIEISTIQ